MLQLSPPPVFDALQVIKDWRHGRIGENNITGCVYQFISELLHCTIDTKLQIEFNDNITTYTHTQHTHTHTHTHTVGCTRILSLVCVSRVTHSVWEDALEEW